MTKYDEIKGCIENGLQKTCSESIIFGGTSISNRMKPEYLLTVNIAKAIAEKQQYFGYPYFIKLEESFFSFSFKCIPPEKNHNPLDIFSTPELSSRKSKKENGDNDDMRRLDIAVYDEKKLALTAIEVALLNPVQVKLKTDIDRLTEILELEDPVTGPSIVKETYFVCLLKSEKIKYAGLIDEYHNDIKKKFKDRLNEILANKKNIGFQIELYKSGDSTVGIDYDGYDDDGDLLHEAKHFAGLIITLKLKSKIKMIDNLLITEKGNKIRLHLDDERRVLTFTDNLGKELGGNFEFEDESGNNERYLLKRCFSPENYFDEGVGEAALRYFKSQTQNSIIYVRSNDGIRHDDGSHFVGEMSLNFITKMRNMGLIEKEFGLSSEDY